MTEMSSHSSFVVGQISICKGFSVETLLQNVADTLMLQVAKIQTTLYDLVASLNAELSPDEDNVVIATVVHLLNTHRVTCTGALRGYRMVCNDKARPGQTPPKGYGCISRFESCGDHFTLTLDYRAQRLQLTPMLSGRRGGLRMRQCCW